MKFSCYGDIEKPAVLLMHGMCQDWHSMYQFLSDLEKNYYLIIPAMDGFYEGSAEWTTFPEQSRQIEEYVTTKHGGKLFGIYGISQGTIVLSELLARNKVAVEKAFFDGTYVAHQGRLSAFIMYRVFAGAKKNNGQFPKVINYIMERMGLSKEDTVMFDHVYWDAGYDAIRDNMRENYLYRVKPEIAKTKTEITLCCGSNEPYAIKSHRMIRKYLPDSKEIILEGYGHGQMVYLHGKELADLIRECWK